MQQGYVHEGEVQQGHVQQRVQQGEVQQGDVQHSRELHQVLQFNTNRRNISRLESRKSRKIIGNPER